MTIREHFITGLSKEDAAKAIANVGTDNTKLPILDLQVRDAAQALRMAFVWEHSPEEHQYWSNIHRTLNGFDKYLEEFNSFE